MNSSSGENRKQTSSSTISTEASFNGDSNAETLNINETCWQLFILHAPQQNLQRKILEKVFITKKFTQCKTSRTLKIDVLVSLTISLKFYSSQLKPLFSAILIMFFIGFPILSYSILPRGTIVLDIPKHMPSQSD